MGFGVWGLGFGVWGLGGDLQQLCHQLALARVLERGVHVQVAFVRALQVVVVVRG